ncbi:MAG: hypothetical protein FWG72_04590 [Oscillospiraceae bacterium]|nr:hypothetical protein [Oscillospiraceae bacterium]
MNEKHRIRDDLINEHHVLSMSLGYLCKGFFLGVLTYRFVLRRWRKDWPRIEALKRRIEGE